MNEAASPFSNGSTVPTAATEVNLVFETSTMEKMAAAQALRTIPCGNGD
jgi:hypothetical protein